MWKTRIHKLGFKIRFLILPGILMNTPSFHKNVENVYRRRGDIQVLV